MKITKRLYVLKPGTIIYTKSGDYIKLTSWYDEYRGGYKYADVFISGKGDVVEIGTTWYVTLSDLIGDEIV